MKKMCLPLLFKTHYQAPCLEKVGVREYFTLSGNTPDPHCAVLKGDMSFIKSVINSTFALFRNSSLCVIVFLHYFTSQNHIHLFDIMIWRKCLPALNALIINDMAMQLQYLVSRQLSYRNLHSNYSLHLWRTQFHSRGPNKANHQISSI